MRVRRWTLRHSASVMCGRNRDVPCQTAMGHVGQWLGRAGPCRAGPAPRPLTSISQAQPPIPHFYQQGLGQPGSPTSHFYRQGLGQPGPQPLTFIDRAQASPTPNPSLLSTGPAARPPTPHFYRRVPASKPSLPLARPHKGQGATSHHLCDDVMWVVIPAPSPT